MIRKAAGCRPTKWLLLAGPFLAGAALLAGCSGTVTREEQLARTDIAEAKSRYRPEDAKPPLPVLTADSGLPDLIRYALVNNPRVESTFHDWAAAVEEITTARSLPDPMLTFSAEISRGVPNLSAALMTDPGMNWPGPGKLPLKAEAAYSEAMKRRALFEDELLSTALAVKRAYYQLWVLAEQVRWTRETLAIVDEMESLARRRAIVGKVTQQDVLRAQMEHDQLTIQLANLEDSREPLLARLRSALGLGPDQPAPPFALRLEPKPADFTEQSLLETAFARNPRLKEVHSEVMQAMALYQLARKSTVPDYSFSVGVSGGMNPVAVTRSLGITLPIWRDKIAAEIARGRAGVDAAKARLAAEQLDLAVRFAETAYAWREADRNCTLYAARLLPKAKAALDSARGGYPAGMTPMADLLEAERTLLGYHLDYAVAAGQREMVLAEMSLVILGRWPEGVAALLPEAPPEPVHENHPPHKG
jgi:cobalt-zinc-cadmium efflux system outer membrane protein